MFFAMFFAGTSVAQTTKTLIFPRVSQIAQADYFPKTLDPSWGASISQVNYHNVGEFQLGIALTNAGTTASSVTFTAYGQDGQLLQGNNITNPSFMPMDDPSISKGEIPAGMQVARYAWQIFGTGVLGKIGWIKLDYTGGDIKGFYFIYNDAFDFMSGTVAIPAENAATQIPLPFFTEGLQIGRTFSTQVDVINPNSTPANITITQWYIQSTDGQTYFGYVNQPAMTYTATIPAFGKIQIEWSCEILVYSGANMPGNNYLLVNSDTPIITSEFVFRNDDAANVNKTYALSVITGRSQKEGIWQQNAYSVPQVTAGSGWFTGFFAFGSQIDYIGKWVLSRSVPPPGDFLVDEFGKILNLIGPVGYAQSTHFGLDGIKLIYYPEDLFNSQTGPMPATVNGTCNLFFIALFRKTKVCWIGLYTDSRTQGPTYGRFLVRSAQDFFHPKRNLPPCSRRGFCGRKGVWHRTGNCGCPPGILVAERPE